jgi:effector-binding domain-containing protein
MEYNVNVAELASQPTAVVRRRATRGELWNFMPDAIGHVHFFLWSSGLPRSGRTLALYLDSDMNIECGYEMPQPFTGNDKVLCSSTPAGLVATAAHLGPYERLTDAHAAVQRWCAEHRYALAGPCWEVFSPCSATDPPSRVRTDVFWLLQPGRGIVFPTG